MRIAIVAPCWAPVPPPAYGGTERVLDVLARGLAAAGHEVMLFATGDSTCPVPRRWHFAQAVGIGRPDGALLEMRHVIAAYAAAAAEAVDVVHDHTLAGPLYAAGFSELAVVTTNHGPFGEGLDEYYRALAPRVPTIAISHAQAATAAGVPLVAVIHHGVDVAELSFGAGDGGFALFLGRIVPAKGVHVAAQVALAAGVHLLIAGKCAEPAERAYFEQRVAPLLGDTIEFVGELGSKRRVELLTKAICLLNPIAWPEPFGMVMLEALACGTPVVATHAGAAAEIVEDGVTGILADDHVGLVDALKQVGRLDRAACRASAEQRFSAKAMVDRHVAVYEAVLRGRARAAAGSSLARRLLEDDGDRVALGDVEVVGTPGVAANREAHHVAPDGDVVERDLR